MQNKLSLIYYRHKMRIKYKIKYISNQIIKSREINFAHCYTDILKYTIFLGLTFVVFACLKQGFTLSSFCLGTLYRVQTNLELVVILLFQLPKCWDSWYGIPCLGSRIQLGEYQ